MGEDMGIESSRVLFEDGASSLDHKVVVANLHHRGHW